MDAMILENMNIETQLNNTLIISRMMIDFQIFFGFDWQVSMTSQL